MMDVAAFVDRCSPDTSVTGTHRMEQRLTDASGRLRSVLPWIWTSSGGMWKQGEKIPPAAFVFPNLTLSPLLIQVSIFSACICFLGLVWIGTRENRRGEESRPLLLAQHPLLSVPAPNGWATLIRSRGSFSACIELPPYCSIDVLFCSA